jgi:hypothetical protein
MRGNANVVSVMDAFEIKPHTAGSEHAPGLVIVFDGRQCSFDLPAIGQIVELLRPDGSNIDAPVGEIKEHGEGRSFFFAGLQREDAPIGTVISWLTAKSEAARARQHATK